MPQLVRAGQERVAPGAVLGPEAELLEGGAELNLTEWSDAELIRLVSLDLKNTSKE